MEALAAVGFAANILQFVDGVCHVLKIGRQLRRNGMTDSNLNLEQSVKFLEHQITRIRSQQAIVTGSGQVEQTLDRLAGECTSVAKELLAFINKFKIDRDTRPTMATERPVLQDEMEIQALMDSTTKHIEDLETKISERKPNNGSRYQQDKSNKLSDEIERDRLVRLRKSHENKLKKIIRREEALFKKAAKKAFEEAAKLWDQRRAIKTLAKAVELEWNKPRIEELVQKFENIRTLLYSEVMLNIQQSVIGLNESFNSSSQLLEDISGSQLKYHAETKSAITKNWLSMKALFQAQNTELLAMDTAAVRRHEAVLQAINSFTEVLKDRLLFPALPKVLTEADPSLKSAALTTYEAIENAVLVALYFRRMDVRESQVQAAFKDTCSWIFEDPLEHQRPWSNFRRWLERENGCYWISGKAGCGKSTLMKYLIGEPRTLKALGKWTNSDELLTASYFFGMAGTSLQKNQEGLLRSLLHSILSRRRDLIARVFPKHYSAMMTRLFADNSSPDIFFSCESPGCSSSFEQPRQLEQHLRKDHGSAYQNERHDDDDCGHLTIEELKAAFMTISKLPLNGSKICLFIDGLDEYVGDQNEIAELFKTITSQSSAIKAVISSRPEPTFEEAFRENPTLRVEDLTTGDVQHYIESHLLSHSKMQGPMHSKLGTKLVNSIASKACGVFLWVFLVVRQLLECLTEGAYPEDLEGIIQSCPAELHLLYKQMFERVKPSHRAEAFRLFHAIHYAQEVEYRIPTALRLSFIEKREPIRSLQESLMVMNQEELRDRLSTFKSRLKSRCCGLLEVKSTNPASSSESWGTDEGQVHFLHRTVSDFLREPGIREMIVCETTELDSEIYERLTASILYSFKHWQFFHLREWLDQKEIAENVQYFLIYCQQDTSQPGVKQVEYLNVLDETVANLGRFKNTWSTQPSLGEESSNPKYHWAEPILWELCLKLSPVPDEDPLLSLAARFGLSSYVNQKLQTFPTDSQFFNTGGRLLVARLGLWGIYDQIQRPHHLKIIKRLLESGLQVNRKAAVKSKGVWAATPWQELLYLQGLQHIHSQSMPKQLRLFLAAAKRGYRNLGDLNTSEADELEFWSHLIELFIEFGADLNAGSKPVRGKAQISTREAILERITEDITHSISFEDSKLVQQARSRIEHLLAQKPVTSQKDQLGQRSIVSTSSGKAPMIITSSQDQLKIQVATRDGSYHSTKTASSRRNHAQSESHRLPTLSALSSTSDRSCSRCRAADELSKLGFQSAQIFRAMETAGVGYDVQALTAWILDNEADPKLLSSPPETATPLLNTSKEVVSTTILSGHVRGVKASFPKSIISQQSTSKQWNVVAKERKTSDTRSDVVGAQWVFKPQKPMPRKSKKRVSQSTEVRNEEESKCSSGAIQLRNGTFTWFFEPENPSQGAPMMSGEQKRRLEELLHSFQS